MPEIKTFGSHLINIDMLPKENAVFIDAGTCEGNFIDDIFEIATNPIIYALEPNRDNYRLVQGYRAYKNMFSREVALVGSGEPKTMRFAQFQGLPEWGNVSGLYSSRKHKCYDVHTMTIREVLDIIPQETIHHLKMDIEGCENGVIADLTTKDAKRIQQISLEVHGTVDDMLEHLDSIGYRTQFEKGELYAVSKYAKEEQYAIA